MSFTANPTLQRRPLPAPTLSRDELLELSGHCYAKWRSGRCLEAVYLIRSKGADGKSTFLVRSESEVAVLVAPVNSVRVATYRNGTSTQCLQTPLMKHLMEHTSAQQDEPAAADSPPGAQSMWGFADSQAFLCGDN